MVAVDPLASLEIYDVDVTLGGEEFRVTGHCAADWLIKILGGTLHNVLPSWIEDAHDRSIFIDMLLDGEIDDVDINKAIKEILGVASGRPAWWVQNLISVMRSEWGQLHGRLVRAGIYPDEMSLGAWCDAAYSCMVDPMQSNEDRSQFDAQMEAMPPDADFDEETEEEAFMNIMGSGIGDM